MLLIARVLAVSNEGSWEAGIPALAVAINETTPEIESAARSILVFNIGYFLSSDAG